MTRRLHRRGRPAPAREAHLELAGTLTGPLAVGRVVTATDVSPRGRVERRWPPPFGQSLPCVARRA